MEANVLHAVRPMGGDGDTTPLTLNLSRQCHSSGSTAKEQSNMRLGGPRWGLGLQEERPAFCASHKSIKVYICMYIYMYVYIYIYIYIYTYNSNTKHFSTTAVSGTGLSSRVENQTGASTLTLTAGSHTSASCNIHALLHGLVSRLVSITICQCQLPCINFCYGLLSIKIANHQLFSTLSVIHSR